MRPGPCLAALLVFASACAPSQPRPGACERVRTTPDYGADHIPPGLTHDYREWPPASGPHDPRPLEAGTYASPLGGGDPSGSPTPTIYRAVHSLEHGYVLVLHRGLGRRQRGRLALEVGRERKVIVAPDPRIDAAVGLVAWRRVQRCRGLDVGAVKAFIARYRERTAPEPQAP